MLFSQINNEDFKRLGVSGDWDHPYNLWRLTMKEHKLVSGEMANKGYIHCGLSLKFTGLGLLNQPCWSRDWIPWRYQRLFTMRTRLKMQAVPVLHGTLTQLSGQQLHLRLQLLVDWRQAQEFGLCRSDFCWSDRALASGAFFAKPFWKNSDGKMLVLATYQGEELNHIVTEHPWDPEADKLVILWVCNLIQVLVSSTPLLVLVRTLQCRDCQWPEVAIVNERGIMMENAGPWLSAGQF